jgi:hypothetical protein
MWLHPQCVGCEVTSKEVSQRIKEVHSILACNCMIFVRVSYLTAVITKETQSISLLFIMLQNVLLMSVIVT